MGVAGVVLIGVLVELLLTDNTISKFIRGIYAFFILLVIVQPLPSFFREVTNEVSAGMNNFTLNQELMRSINIQTKSAFERNAMTALSTAGFDGVIVTLDIDENAQSFTIRTAFVNALGVVLRGNLRGINIEREIVKIVCAICNIEEDRVFYVG